MVQFFREIHLLIYTHRFFVLFLVWVCLVGCVLPLQAQEEDLETLTYDTLYFRRYDEFINVRTFTKFRDLSVGIRSKNNSAPKVVYRPNHEGAMGVGFRLFDLGLSFSLFTPSFLEKPSDKYGKTRFTNIQGNLHGKKWAYDLGYLNYKGFYIANASRSMPSFQENGVLPQRSDIEAMRVMAGVIYVANEKKFNPRAGFRPNHRQLISMGSILVRSTVSYSRISADSSIVPLELQPVYGSGTDLHETNFFTVGLLPGYGYNRVIHKNFYFNVRVLAGAGLQIQKFHSGVDSESTRNVRMSPQLDLRTGVGFDNTRWFTGVIGSIHRSYGAFNQLQVRPDSQSVILFVGHRIRKFGVFKKYSIKQLFGPGAGDR